MEQIPKEVSFSSVEELEENFTQEKLDKFVAWIKPEIEKSPNKGEFKFDPDKLFTDTGINKKDLVCLVLSDRIRAKFFLNFPYLIKGLCNIVDTNDLKWKHNFFKESLNNFRIVGVEELNDMYSRLSR